jgi:hypothetical protein
MKHLLSITVALVVAVSVVGVVTASGKSADSSRHETIHVNAKLTDQKFVDEAPDGPSSGDVALASGKLVTSGGSKTVGRVLFDCVNIPPQHGECSLTLALPGGHLAVLASFGKGFTGKASGNDPIVGGTGSYRDAGGYVRTQEVNQSTQRFTIHLIR